MGRVSAVGFSEGGTGSIGREGGVVRVERWEGVVEGGQLTPAQLLIK